MYEFVRANHCVEMLVKTPHEPVEHFMENMLMLAKMWVNRYCPMFENEPCIILLCVAHLPEAVKYDPLVSKYRTIFRSDNTYNREEHYHEGVHLGTLDSFKNDLHYLELWASQRREINVLKFA